MNLSLCKVVELYLTGLEACIELDRAGKLLQLAVNNDDAIDIELIWDALDQYKHASNLLKGKMKRLNPRPREEWVIFILRSLNWLER